MKAIVPTLVFGAFCLLVAPIFVRGQSNISGLVIDTTDEVPLTSVNVLAKQRVTGAILAFAVTGTDGRFELDVAADSFTLSVSLLGYESLDTLVWKQDAKQAWTVRLREARYNLESVTVKAFKTGIIRNGDTLTYEPTVFQNGTEENLGDVLGRLPGVRVESDGSVSVNGRPVDKLLLNGDDWMNGNRGGAMRSISAADVAEVSVWDEGSQSPGTSSLVLNVKLSDAATEQWRASAKIGGGFEQRYTTDLAAYRLTNSTKVLASVRGANTEQPALTQEDFYSLSGGKIAFLRATKGFEIQLPTALDQQAAALHRSFSTPALNLSTRLGARTKINGYAMGVFSRNQQVYLRQNLALDRSAVLFSDSTSSQSAALVLHAGLHTDWQKTNRLRLRLYNALTRSTDNGGATSVFSYGVLSSGVDDDRNGKIFSHQHQVSATFHPNARHQLMIGAGLRFQHRLNEIGYKGMDALGWVQAYYQEMTNEIRYALNHQVLQYQIGIVWNMTLGRWQLSNTIDMGSQNHLYRQDVGWQPQAATEARDALRFRASGITSAVTYPLRHWHLTIGVQPVWLEQTAGIGGPEKGTWVLLPRAGIAYKSPRSGSIFNLAFGGENKWIIPDELPGATYAAQQGILRTVLSDTRYSNTSTGLRLFFFHINIPRGTSYVFLASAARQEHSLTYNQNAATSYLLNTEVLTPSKSAFLLFQFNKHVAPLRLQMRYKATFSASNTPMFVEGQQVERLFVGTVHTFSLVSSYTHGWNWELGGTLERSEFQAGDAVVFTGTNISPSAKLHFVAKALKATLMYEPTLRSAGDVSRFVHYLSADVALQLRPRLSVFVRGHHLLQLSSDLQVAYETSAQSILLKSYENMPGYVLLGVRLGTENK